MTTITDLFGNQIEVTDIEQAIREAELCADSYMKMASFKFKTLPNGMIIERTDKNPTIITVGEYYRHLLTEMEVIA